MEPVRLLAADSPATREASIEEAARLLLDGSVVGLPTETVYGLACLASNEEAVGRLRALKKRAAEKPLALLIPHTRAVGDLPVDVPESARKLMRIYWPGPVTVVVPGRDGGTVGLRCPAHRLTRNILERVGATVVATSANVSGEAPALTAEEVLERFPEGLAAVVDGGKSDLGIASCVVEFQSDGSWSVVREGIVDAEAIRRRLRTVILFVCTGNTCRSPLAVALTRKLLAEARGVTPDELEGLGTTVFSGGLFASEGSPGAPHAVEAAKALGADMSRHRTHRVTAADLGDADRIIAMTISHARTLASLAPECTERIELLDPEHGDFEDPFGGTLDEYLACARRMEAALRIKLGLGESA